MKISIIVPNYNHKNYLPQRLDCIFHQTYTNFEVILLDDDSQDDSLHLLEKYENHPKVKCLIANSVNSHSPFAQWHKGFEVAEGDLIWIAESDDFCELHFLERLLPFFDDEEVVLSFCSSSIVDEKGEILHERNTWLDDMDTSKWESDFVASGMDYLQSHQQYRNTISNASGVVFRRNSLAKIEHPNLSYRYAGDWLFWNQICALGKIAYLNETLNHWRSHSASTRRIHTLKEETKKLAENTTIIEITHNILPVGSEKRLDQYNWILDWWLSRFSYKNVRKIKYIFPPLPKELIPIFRKRLWLRFRKEVSASLGLKKR